MAAYGVIGGFIGGAISLAITPFLRKKFNKNKKKGKKSQEPTSYRPWGAALFLFLIGIGNIVFGIYFIWCIIYDYNYILYSNVIVLSILVFVIVCGIAIGCWSGSYLGARITISDERLIIEHAARMPNKLNGKIHLWQLGIHHLDLQWEKIKELRADINYMQIVLHNGDLYMFPIGWCKDAATFAVEHHKPIKAWE